jgi:hypothetical protein
MLSAVPMLSFKLKVPEIGSLFIVRVRVYMRNDLK